VREIHHRIKNHLQGVIGLLQNRQSHMPQIATVLQDSIDQIRVIAEVYGLQSQREGEAISFRRLVNAVLQGVVTPVLLNGIEGTEKDGPVVAAGEVMPVSLIINELVGNAKKHVTERRPMRPLRVELSIESRRAVLRLRSGPARLPEGFDYASGLGTGIGLELVRSMSPRSGARISLVQDGDEVVAELELTEPVLFPQESAA
jgi:two-component sensor histidine kinase